MAGALLRPLRGARHAQDATPVVYGVGRDHHGRDPRRSRAHPPRRVPAHRRPQRPGLCPSRSGRVGGVERRPERVAAGPRHGHPATARRRARWPVLVRVGAGGPARARGGPPGARADGHRARVHRALPGHVRAGHHRRRGRSGVRERPDRVAARPRGRQHDRVVDADPAERVRARHPVHDADPLAHDPLGRFGHGSGASTVG